MIQLAALEKTFGTGEQIFRAVKPLTFEIEKGEIFGFLGPNGAGKTTTMRMLMGLLAPTAGFAKIAGYDTRADLVEVKRRVGYLPDQPVFYDYLRGSELLGFVAEMHGYSRYEAKLRAATALAQFGLTDAGQDFAINYSLGMKKRLGLAMALIHEPQVLILDEPTNGLDPRAAIEIEEKLLKYQSEGRTILLSTHLLDMAARLCSRLAIMDRGELRAVGTVASLRQNFAAGGSLQDVFLTLTETESSLDMTAGNLPG